MSDNNTAITGGGEVSLSVSIQFDTSKAIQNLKAELNTIGKSFNMPIDTTSLSKAVAELQKISDVKLTLEGQAETLKYFTDVTAELEKQLEMAVKIRENYERTGTNGKMSRSEYNGQQKSLYENASKLLASMVEDEKTLLTLTGENKKQAQQLLENKRQQLKNYQEKINHENYSFLLSQKISETETEITQQKIKQNELEKVSKANKERELQAKKENETLIKIQETYDKILKIRTALYSIDKDSSQAKQLQNELKTLQQSMGGYKGKEKWSGVIANQERALETQYNLNTSSIDQSKLKEEQKAHASLYQQATKYLDEYVAKSKALVGLTGDHRKEGAIQLKQMTQQLNQYEQMLSSTGKLNEFQIARLTAEEKINTYQLQQEETSKRLAQQATEKAQKEKETATAKKETESQKASLKKLEESYKTLYGIKYELSKMDKDDPGRETMEKEHKRLSQIIGSYKGKKKYKEAAIELEKKYQQTLDLTIAKEASKNYTAGKTVSKQTISSLNKSVDTLSKEELKIHKQLLKSLAEENRLKQDIQKLDIKDIELLAQEKTEVGAIADSLLKIKAQKQAILNTRSSLGIEGDLKETTASDKAERELAIEYEKALSKQRQLVANEMIQNDLIDARNFKQEQLNQKRIQALKTSIQALENGRNADYYDKERLKTLKEQLAVIEKMNVPDLASHKLRLVSADLTDITKNANITRMKELGTSTGLLGNAFKSLGIYVSGSMLITKLFSELKQGISIIREVDSTLTTLRITMTNFTEQDIANTIEASKELATELKTSFTDVMEVIKTVANESESLDTILAKSTPALILSNLTGLSTAETVEMIQGVTRQYASQFEELGLTAEEQGMKVADVLVSISRSLGMDFSTGIKGMAEGIEIMGALSNELNMSLESTMALMASTSEQTRLSFSEIANAFKTTMARTIRISGTEDEISPDDLAKTERALRGVGIEVRDLITGELRSFIDIMDDLAVIWDDLTDSQRGAIGDAMGKNTAPLRWKS